MTWIYFDNNSTKKLDEDVISAIIKYNTFPYMLNVGTDVSYAKETSGVIDEYINELVDDTGLFPIFTSGSSESNSTVFNMFPSGHIISTEYEHPSIDTILSDRGGVTFIKPELCGTISPKDVANAVRSDTVLVSIIRSNNEIPVVNNINEIFKLVKKKNRNTITHTDDTQLFSKGDLSDYEYADLVSFSGHKFGGPKSGGGLLIRESIIDNFVPLIHGKQQGGMRGGTEDQAIIIPTYIAYLKSKENGTSITAPLVVDMHKKLNTFNYVDYLKNKRSGFIYFGSNTHPTTVLICAYFPKKKVCNIVIKEKLYQNNIIVSIGSACNTSNPDVSKVLKSIDLPNELKKGILRISFADYNTVEEIDVFVETLKCIIDEFDSV